MTRLLLGMLIIMLVGSAQSRTPLADEGHEELAREFIMLSRLDQRRAQMLEMLDANLREAVKHDPILQNDGLSKDEQDELFDVIQQEVEAALQDLSGPMDQQIVAFYAERFSEDELKDLIAIYKSPVFNKQLDLLPDLIEQNNALVRSQLGALQLRMAERMRRWMDRKEAE